MLNFFFFFFLFFERQMPQLMLRGNVVHMFCLLNLFFIFFSFSQTQRWSIFAAVVKRKSCSYVFSTKPFLFCSHMFSIYMADRVDSLTSLFLFNNWSILTLVINNNTDIFLIFSSYYYFDFNYTCVNKINIVIIFFHLE